MEYNVIVHGHFYQPPRENPWTGEVDIQPSAAPFHDWNARITRECYAANGVARLLDNEGKVRGLSNNYEWMSFNIGATLMSWMSEHAPDALRAVVEGDRRSAQRCDGHGNALAQVYNHVIMPLASERDKRTQVRWGIADFRKHFGREPEGMWLAETAVDTPTLEALAAEGIKFTVLAPRQASRWRNLDTEQWTEGAVDPSKAYLCKLPSGRSISLFFYDGPISQAVAFERLLDSGEKFLGRLKSGLSDQRPHDQVVHIATDGESYGHHHKQGEMCLAWTLEAVRNDPGLKLTNYGEFLAHHPATVEVEIRENSSWSCEHGVERWRSNCGCNSRNDYHQKWRAPLRQSLNFLKGKLDALYDVEAAHYFADPWAARDAYIRVVLDGEQLDKFIEAFGKPDLADADIRRAVNLLEMQRNGMLMFTSCGWFFDEISGIETVQDLMYAARALQLVRLFGWDLEEEFVKILEQAPSNLDKYGNGRGVWMQMVRPIAVRSELEYVFTEFDERSDIKALVSRAVQLIDAVGRAGLTLDLWVLQNRAVETYAKLACECKSQKYRPDFAPLAERLGVKPDVLGWNNAGIPCRITPFSNRHCRVCEGATATEVQKNWPWNK